MAERVPTDTGAAWEWASWLNGWLLGLVERARAEGHAPFLESVELLEVTPTTMTLALRTSTGTLVRLTVRVEPG